MQQRTTLTGWRRAGLAVGSLALVAAGAGAVATQAFADTGHASHAAAPKPKVDKPSGQDLVDSVGGKASTKPATKKAGKKSGTQAGDCSDLRSDLTFTDVPQAAQALQDAVAAEAPGTVSDARGERVSATCHHPEAVTAHLSYAPGAGAPAGQVAVSFLQDDEFAYAGGAAAYVSSCDDDLADCRVSTLPDGSTVRTYAIRMDLDGGTWEILVAERLVGDHVISVQAQGPRADDGTGTVLAPHAVLSTQQITDIAAGLGFIG